MLLLRPTNQNRYQYSGRRYQESDQRRRFRPYQLSSSFGGMVGVSVSSVPSLAVSAAGGATSSRSAGLADTLERKKRLRISAQALRQRASSAPAAPSFWHRRSSLRTGSSSRSPGGTLMVSVFR